MTAIPFKLQSLPIDTPSLTSVQAEQLCMSLIQSNTEEEIIETLEHYNYWDNDECWMDFGNVENNWSQIGNQSASADCALVEKIINSIDHVLIGECKVRGIPVDEGKSSQTPQSIVEAVEIFFNVKQGLLADLDKKTRSALSEKVKLISVGLKSNPCYIIADAGEGQSPKNMPDTLLSLNKSNKLRIPFVQGKFNMGGTGVLRFCGEHSFQFILSKRNPNIGNIDNDPTFDQWGFTITYKKPPTKNVRSSVVRYLAPHGKVLSFKSDRLPILPGEYPSAYKAHMEYGTFIKLYNYNLLKSYRSLINFHLYNRLALLIPNIALPIRLYERRKEYKAHSYESTLSGLSVRLEEDQNENLERSFPIDLPPMKQQKISGNVYVFKKGKIDSYSKTEGVVFTVNGQTHGMLKRHFFDKDNVGLSYISDSLLVTLDCSNITNSEKEKLFMNSRDRLNKDASLKLEIEKELEIFLKNHKGLKEINNKRRQESIMEHDSSSDKLNEILQKIISKSPVLAQVLKNGGRIRDPFSRRDLPTPSLELKKFPDYFKLAYEMPQEKPKRIPIDNSNGRFSIAYDTNAENQYFNREREPGEFKLIINGKPYTEFSVNLWEGRANADIKISNDWSIGTILKCESVVADLAHQFPFKHTFFIQIDKAQNSCSRKKKSSIFGNLDLPKYFPCN